MVTHPLHQATAVAIAGRGVMIEGPPGSGKSSLALALIDRGAVLIGDDGLALWDEDGALFAKPAPAITGKLEIRHVGIVEMAWTSARIALGITLGTNAPRFPETAIPQTRAGIDIPFITLPPHDGQLALRVEYALRRYGEDRQPVSG